LVLRNPGQQWFIAHGANPQSKAGDHIVGTISSVDAVQNMLTVMDLATTKPVGVKISAQSQIMKLPPKGLRVSTCS